MPDGGTVETGPALSQSPEIDKLAAALAKAQGAIENPKRDREVTVTTKTGGSYKFSYATLGAVQDAIRKPLADNGLAYTHLVTERAGRYRLVTRLMHASGQWLESETPLFVAEQGNQAFGSALSYGKRYALSAMLGVAADEDDDGNAADGNAAEKRDRAPARRAAPKPPADESADKAAAREKFTRIMAAIKTAPNDGVLQNVMDDAKDDIAFVRKHGGNEAALAIATKAEERRRDLQTGGPSEEGARAVTRAAIRVKERSFQDFLGVQGEAAADEALKRHLNIQSKREIGTNPKALAAFKRIEGEAEDYARFGPSPSEAAE